MIKWRQSPNAHKFFRANFNLRQTCLVMKMWCHMCGGHEKSPEDIGLRAQ
jgi:hypothetical protein